jgi:hypothetical protein
MGRSIAKIPIIVKDPRGRDMRSILIGDLGPNETSESIAQRYAWRITKLLREGLLHGKVDGVVVRIPFSGEHYNVTDPMLRKTWRPEGGYHLQITAKRWSGKVMTIRVYTDEATRRKITAVTWNGGHCSASAEAKFNAEVAKRQQNHLDESDGPDHVYSRAAAARSTPGKRSTASFSLASDCESDTDKSGSGGAMFPYANSNNKTRGAGLKSTGLDETSDWEKVQSLGDSESRRRGSSQSRDGKRQRVHLGSTPNAPAPVISGAASGAAASRGSSRRHRRSEAERLAAADTGIRAPSTAKRAGRAPNLSDSDEEDDEDIGMLKPPPPPLSNAMQAQSKQGKPHGVASGKNSASRPTSPLKAPPPSPASSVPKADTFKSSTTASSAPVRAGAAQRAHPRPEDVASSSRSSADAEESNAKAMIEATLTPSITAMTNRLELLLEREIERKIHARSKLEMSESRNAFLRDENRELKDTVKMLQDGLAASKNGRRPEPDRPSGPAITSTANAGVAASAQSQQHRVQELEGQLREREEQLRASQDEVDRLRRELAKAKKRARTYRLLLDNDDDETDEDGDSAAVV